jgi:hypothetical protein
MGVGRYLTGVTAPLKRLSVSAEGRLRPKLFRYHQREGSIGQVAAADYLRSRYGDVVASGPFVGMRFAVDAATDQCLGPTLLGEYESELFDIVEGLCATPWERIVDVGCACGYYLTGLTMRCPTAKSYGFDIEPHLQEVARRVAEDNGVADRVEVSGLCSHERLNELAGPGALVFVDIEGGERELLRPDLVPALLESTLLVELHDFAEPGVSSDMLMRFHDTHKATVVMAEQKRWADHPAAAAVPRPYRRWALDERRPAGMRWVLLEPLA